MATDGEFRQPCGEDTDYRSLLRLQLAECMEQRRFRFASHRALSQELEISPALLSLVLAGKRHLSVGSDAFVRLLALLQFSAEEREYIELLARQSQAKNHKDKLQHGRRLSHFRATMQHRELMSGQKELLENWRNMVVFEVIAQQDTGLTLKELDEHLVLELEPQSLEEVLAVLLKLDLIHRRTDRYYAKVKSLNIEDIDDRTARLYHGQMAEVACKALKDSPEDRRRYGTLTVAICETDLQECLQEIDKLRHRLRAILCQYNMPNADTLLQVNLQSFLLSNPQQGAPE